MTEDKNEDENEEEWPNLPVPKPKVLLKCREPRCSKQFTSISALRRHLRTYHKRQVFQCQTCGRECSRKDVLVKHQRSSCPGPLPTNDQPFTLEYVVLGAEEVANDNADVVLDTEEVAKDTGDVGNACDEEDEVDAALESFMQAASRHSEQKDKEKDVDDDEMTGVGEKLNDDDEMVAEAEKANDDDDGNEMTGEEKIVGEEEKVLGEVDEEAIQNIKDIDAEIERILAEMRAIANMVPVRPLTSNSSLDLPLLDEPMGVFGDDLLDFPLLNGQTGEFDSDLQSPLPLNEQTGDFDTNLPDPHPSDEQMSEFENDLQHSHSLDDQYTELGIDFYNF